MTINMIGTILNYDVETDILILKLNYTDMKNQEDVEEMIERKDTIVFSVNNNKYRKSKSYAQLKKYFSLLKQILKKNEQNYSLQNMKTLDLYIKRSLLKSEIVTIGDEQIPILPSKADLTEKEFSEFIEKIIDLYNLEVEV
jgi:hypothetical protein